ncbi:MAG: hypothetical protein GX032_02060 [Tenericutes bacterium]|nr:hypothetical protein [Mycoplasmatota bacterium]
MKEEELIRNNYMKTTSLNENGYFETHYFDNSWNYTTEDKSINKIIKYFDENGNQIDEDIIDNCDINKYKENTNFERINKKTPSGGDYSEAHFFDNDWKYTTKDQAQNIVIRECNNDGTLLRETYMHKNNTDDTLQKK